jgi:hypothetical protein
MRARGLPWLVLVLACCGALSTIARAAAQRPPPVVVARDGAATLTVEDVEGGLCLSTAGNTTCGDSADGVVVVGSDSQRGYVGVAIMSAALRVEVRRAGALLGAAPTTDGAAYAGRSSGKVRFALVGVPASTRPRGLRVYGYDAAGALIAAVAGSELVFDRRRVLKGRSGRARWSILSHRESRLTPALFDLAHETVSRCVEVELTKSGVGGKRVSTDGGGCVSDPPRDNLSLLPGFGGELELADECNPAVRLLHGVVDASVQRVTALRGDGTRRRARIAQLPGGDERVYALAIPRTHAVRSVQLRSRAGSRTIEVREPPLAMACAEGENSLSTGFPAFGFGSLDDLPPVTPAGPVTAIPGDPAMRVADGPGDTLCVAVDAVPFNALGCAIVGPLSDEVLGVPDSLAKPRAFALAVPANVALVRITAGGRTIGEGATVAAPGYAGRYAGLVRFATLKVPPGESFENGRPEYLDAAGRLLYREEEDSGSEPLPTVRALPARRIAGRAGAPSLWQTTTFYGSQRLRCLRITPGPRPGNDAACAATRAAATVLLDAPCTTHRMTVAIAATPGSRASAETGSGRRPIALRSGAGILTLAPGTSLRAVRIVRSGRVKRVAINAAPVRDQCGWSATPGM